ncbi:MAG: SMC-Scp complex subunit ScpB [Gammaproteobacteria bacterium]|nr:SMC-Scp complex subunit ScpB [Gammaproteobacteria bacterium]MBA3731503.1 SMC-Scp complex subunit ScpB [Gammaproteobacteria bacterium]
MELRKLKSIIEAALLAADRPLSVEQLAQLVADDQGQYSRDAIREALGMLEADCDERGVELKRVASGYRYQVRQAMSSWISRLWEEKPPRYSRALLETLALIAYRQPITRGDIEAIRGVAVSTGIVNTLQEREWIRVVGHRDVPGRPAMYGTTHQFLDYFNLGSLDALPALAELVGLDKAQPQLDLVDSDIPPEAGSQAESCKPAQRTQIGQGE